MGQTIIFILFIVILIIGALGYFFPKHQAITPFHVVMDKGDNQMTGGATTKKSQKLNVITNSGVIQINRELDDLTQKQKDLEDMIKDEQAALDNTNNEISGIMKKGNGKSDLDILRLKALGEELQNEKSLLVAHGRQLIALKDQIDKKRKLLAENRDEVNSNTGSILQSQQDHEASLNDQASKLFDNVKHQNDDFLQHSKDLIDQERQKAKDRKNR